MHQWGLTQLYSPSLSGGERIFLLMLLIWRTFRVGATWVMQLCIPTNPSRLLLLLSTIPSWQHSWPCQRASCHIFRKATDRHCLTSGSISLRFWPTLGHLCTGSDTLSPRYFPACQISSVPAAPLWSEVSKTMPKRSIVLISECGGVIFSCQGADPAGAAGSWHCSSSWQVSRCAGAISDPREESSSYHI